MKVYWFEEICIIKKGYEVIPVNPTITEVFGQKSYPSIDDIPADITVDLVDIFRKSVEVMPVVRSAVKRGVRKIWLQEGVKNTEAIKFAEDNGALVAADICLMKIMKKNV